MSETLERKVQAELNKGTGILKTAKLIGVGVATVQRIKASQQHVHAAANVIHQQTLE